MQVTQEEAQQYLGSKDTVIGTAIVRSATSNFGHGFGPPVRTQMLLTTTSTWDPPSPAVGCLSDAFHSLIAACTPGAAPGARHTDRPSSSVPGSFVLTVVLPDRSLEQIKFFARVSERPRPW